MDIDFDQIFFDENFYKTFGFLKVELSKEELYSHYLNSKKNCTYELRSECPYPNNFFSDLILNDRSHLLFHKDKNGDFQYVLNTSDQESLLNTLNLYLVSKEENICKKLNNNLSVSQLEELLLKSDLYSAFILSAVFLDKESYQPSIEVENFLMDRFVGEKHEFDKLKAKYSLKILENFNVCGEKEPTEYIDSLLAKFVLDSTDRIEGVRKVLSSINTHSAYFKEWFLNLFKERVLMGMDYPQELFEYLDNAVFPDGKKNSIENLEGSSLEKNVVKILLVADEHGKFQSKKHLLNAYTSILLNKADPVSWESTHKILTRLLLEQINDRNISKEDEYNVLKNVNALLEGGFGFDSSFTNSLFDMFARGKNNYEMGGYWYFKTLGNNLNLLTYSDYSLRNLVVMSSLFLSKSPELIIKNRNAFQNFYNIANFILDRDYNIGYPLKSLSILDTNCDKLTDNQKRLFNSLASKVSYESKCLKDNTSFRSFPYIESNIIFCSNYLSGTDASYKAEQDKFCQREDWSYSEKNKLLFFLIDNKNLHNDSVQSNSRRVLKFLNNYRITPSQHNDFGKRVIDILTDPILGRESHILEGIKSVYFNNLDTEPVPKSKFKDKILELNQNKKFSPFNHNDDKILDESISFLTDVRAEYDHISEVLDNSVIAFDFGSDPKKDEILFVINKTSIQFRYLDYDQVKTVILTREAIGSIYDKISKRSFFSKKIAALIDSGYRVSLPDAVLDDLRDINENEIKIHYSLGKIYFYYLENHHLKIEEVANPAPEIVDALSEYALLKKLDHNELNLNENLTRGFLKLFKKAFFRKYVDDKDEFKKATKAQIIAHCARVLHETTFERKYSIRDIQLFSAISLINEKGGKILQVSTGEGKSVIVAMSAAYDALQGYNVDIMSSSEELVKRDARENKPFFNSLGLTVDHVETHDDSEVKRRYQNQILYGTLGTFSAHKLREEEVADIRQYRSFDKSYIDEVDDQLVDNINHITLLSSNLPGFNRLTCPLFYNTIVASKIFQDTKYENGTYSIESVRNATYSEMTDDEERELGSQVIGDGDDYKRYIVQESQRELQNSTIAKGFKLTPMHDYSDGRTILVPNYLRDLITPDFVKPWVDSIFHSLRNKERSEYVIRGNKDSGNSEIKIYNRNNGIIHENLKWRNGLHQITAAKHGLIPEGMSPTSNFISSLKYLLNYYKISGLTGTKGEFHDQYYKDVFDIETEIIPTFLNKNLIIYDPQIKKNVDSYHHSIAESVNDEVGEGRPVLIILEDFKACEEIGAYLERELANVNIKYYFDHGDESHKKSALDRVSPGDVIIASNLGGRGTDFKLTSASVKNGGLHVIFGYYPDSSRKLWQGFGRAARSGQPGSAELIAFPKLYNEFDYEELNALRDEQESTRMKEMSEVFTKEMLFKDSFQSRRVELTKYISNDERYSFKEYFSVEPDDDIIEDNIIYIFKGADDNIIIKLKSSDSEVISIDLTKKLQSNFPKELRHFIALMNTESEGSDTYLNKGDIILLKFILSLNYGIIDDIKVINRVDAHYYKKIKEFLKTQNDDVSSSVKKLREIDSELKFTEDELIYFAGQITKTEEELGEEDLAEFDSKRTALLYSLWKLDYEKNSKEFINRQLKANFALWFNRHVEGAQSDDVEFNPLDHKDEINLAWENFANNAKESAGSREFFTNPAFLVQRAQNDIWDRKLYFEDIGIESDSTSNSYSNRRFCQPYFYSQSFYDYRINRSRCFGPFELVYNNSELSWGNYTHFYEDEPFTSARVDLEYSVKLDKNFATPSYQTLSVLDVLENSDMVYYEETEVQRAQKVKAQVQDYLFKIKNLVGHNIIRKEADCMQLLIQLAYNTHLSSERYQACVNEKLYWNNFDENIQKNIDLVQSALQNNQLVLRLKSVDDISEFMEAVTTEDVAKEIKKEQSFIEGSSSTNNNTRVDNSTEASIFNELIETRSELAYLLESTAPNATLLHTRKNPQFITELQSQGYLNFQLETYELVEEEDDDWFGTIFAGIISIGMIAFGVGIASAVATASGAAAAGATTTASLTGMNAFAYSFGTSMAISGVSSLIGITTNAIAGEKTDISAFMKGAAFNILTNVLTAGISATFASYSTTLGQDLFKEAGKFSSTKAFLLGSVQFGVGKAANFIAEEYYKKNQGHFEKDARNLVRDILITHKDEIKQLLMEDEYQDKSEFLSKLAKFVYERFNVHSSKYHSNLVNLAKSGMGTAFGEASRIALGGAGSIYSRVTSSFMGGAAVNLAVGHHEVENVAMKATEDLGNEIHRLATSGVSSFEMMKQRFIENVGDNLLAEHYFNNAYKFNPSFFSSSEAYYQNCVKIKDSAFKVFTEDRRQDLYNACEDIAKLALNAEENYKNNFDYMLSTISGGISGKLGSVWRDQVIATLMSFSLSQGASYLLNKFGPQDDDVENKKSTSNTAGAGSAADNPPQTPESRATDILRETKEKVLQFNRRGEVQFAQAKLPVGSDYGGKFNGIKLAAAETSGLYSGSGATSSSFSSDSADIKREDITIQESAPVRAPVMDPVGRHVTSVLSSDKAHDILSNPVKKTAYGLAFSSFTDKGIDINHEQLYQRVNNVHAEFTDKGWLGKAGDWLSSLGVKEANAATSLVKLDADSLKLANDIADRVVESLFELKNFSSYKEFEKYAITQININLNDPAELDYLKSSYELYKTDGEVELSLYGLGIHKMGYKLDQFIKDNPRAVWSAKKTVSDIAYGSKKIGEGFSYVVGPWWDEFVKGVNYFIPDEVNEWIGEQANKGVESYKKWESKLTDKQRLIVDTARAGGEVALDLSIIAPIAGGISKVAGSIAVKDITKRAIKITGEKVLKQTDDLLVKNADDVDVVKMEVGGKKADTANMASKSIDSTSVSKAKLLEAQNAFDKFVKRFNLYDHEGGPHKGHAIAKHASKLGDKHLIDRYNHPKKYDPNQFKIRGASEYYNKEIAEKSVLESIQNNKEKIIKWHVGKKEKLLLTQRFEHNIGRGINDKMEFVHDQKAARTILVKDANGNIKIETSYPIDKK